MMQFIAEIGLNHLGSEERARRMLERLLTASIDAITFQIRENRFYKGDDVSRRRLSEGFYKWAAKIIHEKGRRLGIAIGDESTIPFFDSLGVDFWKTLSWDFKNHSLNALLQLTGKTVFMSTGLANMEDIIEVSLKWKNVVLIHTQLSQKIEDVNLKAIHTIRNRNNLPVAFGLHCSNHDVLKLAICFEPEAIFFYVKEQGCSGLFDDEHAIPMNQVGDWVDSLNVLMKALGTGTKEAMDAPSWIAH
jgi:sialic acid synthase SpsE